MALHILGVSNYIGLIIDLMKAISSSESLYFVELNLDFLQALAPVNVAVRREVMYWNISPSIFRVILSSWGESREISFFLFRF